MDLRMLAFFAFALVFSVSMHAYLGYRFTGPLHGDEYRTARRSIWTLAISHAIFFPIAVGQMPRTGEPLADWLQLVGWATGGVFSLVLILTLLKDVAWLALGLWDRLSPQTSPLPADPGRRAFLQTFANAGIGAATALIGGVALIGGRLRPAIERITLPIGGLSPALVGLRIVQISDIHVGPTIRRERIAELVGIVNGLEPDLIAVTGDLVDGSVKALAPHVAPLKDLSAPLGSWFVTGNHEYYSGVLPWCAHCEDELGMVVLNDAHRVVQHKGASIVVGGVTDLRAPDLETSHVSDPQKAFAGAPQGDFRLLLAHQPESLHAAAGLGVHLQLSGHTHGGQYFPYTWLIRLVKKWSRGLHRVGETWLYVNRGTTYWGPPMRLDSRQEITVIELSAA
ncbi:MAG: metallophosphoesterase [Deltaproteobacteria bacterium]|nr:metallophosphoesterase [Deltaproteobacteria bacterium]